MVINVMLQHAGGRKDTTILTLVIRIKCKPNKNSLVSNISRKVEKKKHIFELACVQNKSKRLRSASDELLEDFCLSQSTCVVVIDTCIIEVCFYLLVLFQ